MTGVYDNKHFPLQTKIVLKFCSTCKKLKPLKQYNKCPWNTYFLEPMKKEKRKKNHINHSSLYCTFTFILMQMAIKIKTINQVKVINKYNYKVKTQIFISVVEKLSNHF
jgi:hypothetical protein